MSSILYSYQQKPSEQLIRALTHGQEEWGFSGAVDLSDVGVGKTAMDLNAMLQIGRNPVVLCPVAGIPGWQKMLGLFGAEAHYLGTPEGVKLGGKRHIAKRYGSDFHWENAGSIGIILDEAQSSKGMHSLTTACMDAAINQNIPIICASATLAASPLELPIAGRITGLHTGGEDWLRFMVAHGCRYNEEEARWIWNRQMHHLEQIHAKLIPQRGCRVRKADMGEHPGSSISILPIQCEEGPRIQREWQAGIDQLKRMERQGYPKHVIINTRRTLRMRLWQESEMALVPHVAERIKADLAEEKSVVAFLGFVKSRELLGRLLNRREGFYGGQPQHQRAYLEREFQADRIHVLLNQIKAGGASVSLHDIHGNRPRVAYIFPSDSAVAFGQAPGRVDRAGSKSRATQWIPCIAGGLTEAMVRTTSKKLMAMGSLNDGGSRE